MKRLSLILPNMDIHRPIAPTHCPYVDCQSTNLRLHQEVVKPLRDTRYQQVIAYRYQCLTCKRTFRVYPPGVNGAPTSQRVKELGVTLYLLGLSYRAVSHILEATGVYLCASGIYGAVKNARRDRPELQRQQVFDAVKTFYGTNTTKVKYHDRWLALSLAVDNSGNDVNDMMLIFDDLADEDAESLRASIALFAQVRIDTLQENVRPHEFAIIPAEEQEQPETINVDGELVYTSSDIAMVPAGLRD